MLAIKERITKLLEQLNVGIYEKEEVLALALLSSIPGEGIFLLGPPGVAKSLIARRLNTLIKMLKCLNISIGEGHQYAVNFVRHNSAERG